MTTSRDRIGRRAFTLVELLVAMAILSLLLVLMTSMTDQVARVWKRTSGTISAFQESRAAFETITRKLSQATLDTYWDYDPPISAGGAPSSYVRRSDLHFLSGPANDLLTGVSWIQPIGHAIFFGAPLGYSSSSSSNTVPLGSLMNAKGFFVHRGSNSAQLPNFLKSIIPTRERYRLMEFWQPTEQFSVYDVSPTDLDANPNLGRDWYKKPLESQPQLARPLAENVIALVLWPQRARTDVGTPLTSDYRYDTREYLSDPAASVSRNLLPPTVQVTMVVLDDESCPAGGTLEFRAGALGFWTIVHPNYGSRP